MIDPLTDEEINAMLERDTLVISRFRPRVVETNPDNILNDYKGWMESILFEAEHDRRSLLVEVLKLRKQTRECGCEAHWDHSTCDEGCYAYACVFNG